MITPSSSPVERFKSATTSHTNFNQISLKEIPILVVVVTAIQEAVAALYLCFV